MTEHVPTDHCAPDCAERTTCPTVGGLGHSQCGSCPKHQEPRHHCGCTVPASIPYAGSETVLFSPFGGSAEHTNTYDDGTKVWTATRQRRDGYTADRGLVYDRTNGKSTAKCNDRGMIGRGVYGSGPTVLYFNSPQAAFDELVTFWMEQEAERQGAGL